MAPARINGPSGARRRSNGSRGKPMPVPPRGPNGVDTPTEGAPTFLDRAPSDRPRDWDPVPGSNVTLNDILNHVLNLILNHTVRHRAGRSRVVPRKVEIQRSRSSTTVEESECASALRRAPSITRRNDGCAPRCRRRGSPWGSCRFLRTPAFRRSPTSTLPYSSHTSSCKQTEPTNLGHLRPIDSFSPESTICSKPKMISRFGWSFRDGDSCLCADPHASLPRTMGTKKSPRRKQLTNEILWTSTAIVRTTPNLE